MFQERRKVFFITYRSIVRRFTMDAKRGEFKPRQLNSEPSK